MIPIANVGVSSMACACKIFSVAFVLQVIVSPLLYINLSICMMLRQPSNTMLQLLGLPGC